MIGQPERLLVPLVVLVLAGTPAPLPAQLLNPRSATELARDRQRLNHELNGLLKANQGAAVYERVGDLVQTERALIVYLEKMLPFTEPVSMYLVIAELRGSLAANLQWLARLNEERGDLAAALANGRALLALELQRHGPERWETADARRFLADIERLEALGQSQRQELGEARALNRRALRLDEEGKAQEAIPLAEKALAIRERILGTDHPQCATSLNNLAGLYSSIGDGGRAEGLYRRALELRTRTLGEHHPHYANSLNNLGDLYLRRGDCRRAEALVRQALEVDRETLGANHPDTVAALSNLASIEYTQGNYDQAAPLFREELAITRRQFGEDHPRYAASLNNLANLAKAQGDRPQAEALFQQALALRRRTLGESHPAYAASLNNLGVLYFEEGAYDKAEPLLRQALEIRRKALGTRHVDSAESLNNLAQLLAAKGALEQAESLCREAVDIRSAILGLSHPYTALVSSELAAIVATRGRWEEAAEIVDRSRRALRESVGQLLLLPSLSERDRLSLLWVAYRHCYFSALSLGRARIEDRRFAERSAGWVLNGKSVIQQELAARLSTARGQRAGRGEWVEVDEVRKALPSDAVLIEIAGFPYVDPGRQGQGRPIPDYEPRYAAWIIPPQGQGDIQLIDLGPAARIEPALAAYRQAISAGAESIDQRGEVADAAEFKKRLEAIADLVLRPLESILSRSRRWLISPDATLWLVPWGALPLRDGGYSLERHTISYLVSGRDLVERAPAQAAARGGLVVADPDFDLEMVPRLDSAAQGESETETRTSATPLPANWPRLPGTALEAAAIEPRIDAFLGEPIKLFTGPEALEATVKSAARPRVVVLSTHGFFLKDQDRGAVPASVSVSGAPNASLENPLLRCGLVFTGANLRDHATDRNGDDGILTGLEIVGADLRGTELVVLSACETGRGIIHIGEGVAGLRQAFQLAGARSVVATLWQIPDEETVRLMTLFWENLAARVAPDEALRSAQLGLIRERLEAGQTAHPYFWAAFTLTGPTTTFRAAPAP
jgi:CHAT domain-containing protein/Tfp pilus assembly protein PilF